MHSDPLTRLAYSAKSSFGRMQFKRRRNMAHRTNLDFLCACSQNEVKCFFDLVKHTAGVAK